MSSTTPSRYFQARLDCDPAVAAYQPLQISHAGADSIVFLPIGEPRITLAGAPEDYRIQSLGSGPDSPLPLTYRSDLSPSITLLDLSHWIFQRSSRVNTPHSCAQLRVDERFSTEELAANLHSIYRNHLLRPDADFELRCRSNVKGLVCDDRVTLARSCRTLHRAATDLGVIGSGRGERVEIIIPTYGQVLFTLRCIVSVLRDLLINRDSICGRFDVTLQVVDDAHPEQEGHIVLQHLADQGCIRFHVNPSNLGFLESCNQAVLRSPMDSFIVLLNNDIEVLPGWLLGLLDTFSQEQRVGLVGSKLIYPDGRLQEAGGIVWRDGSAWNLGRLKRPDHPDFNYARSADYISGASIMLRRSTWDAVGGFDRRFRPAYYEDTDLALTVRDHGLKVIYQPTSQAIHHEGISCGTDLSQGIKAYQAANQVKFLEKWRERLSGYQPNGEDLSQAKHRDAVGHILVIENLLLDPEGDAGSLFMMNYCLALQELGYVISYVPMDNLCRMDDKAMLMGSRGIQILAYPEIESIHDIFEKQNMQFDLVLMARPGNFQHFSTLKKLAPDLPVAYFTHDLHFLRTERTAENLTDPVEKKKILRKSTRLKQLETDIFKAVDLVLHISEQENKTAQTLHPHPAVVLPPVVSSKASDDAPSSIDGPIQILFVGNFAHAPNVTAAHWLVKEIWPLIQQQQPDLELLIAGKNPPEGLSGGRHVQVLGYVDDLGALLNRVQIGIAPLLEGAGVKGKVLSALAHGLPMVTTSIGAEGIVNDASSCEAIRIADSAETLASAVVDLSRRSSLEREQLSEQGRAFIAEHFGPPSLVKSFRQMLDRLQLNYRRDVTSFVPYMPRSSDERFDQTNSLTHWAHPLA